MSNVPAAAEAAEFLHKHGELTYSAAWRAMAKLTENGFRIQRPAPAVPDDVAERDIWQMRAEEAEEVASSLRAAIEAQAAELARLRALADALVNNPGWGTVNYTDGDMWADADKLRAALLDAHTAAQPAPDAVAEAAIREAYEAGWHMTEAFCVHEDSYQMAAAERLENALTALRDAIPEVDSPANKEPRT